MAKVKDIITAIENKAPLETQEEWDNSGWQINLHNKTSKKILLALDITEETVNQAISEKCDLIISHHPLFYKPIKCISKKAVILAIKNNIQIYSSHTCFDKSQDGTTQTLVNTLKKELKFVETESLNDFTKIIRIKTPLKLQEFTDKIKKALNIKSIKIANPTNEIKTIAICAGAGADFITDVQAKNIDCYITSDIKYHQARECSIMLVDIGHFESEIIAIKSFKKILEPFDIELILSNETPIFQII